MSSNLTIKKLEDKITKLKLRRNMLSPYSPQYRLVGARARGAIYTAFYEKQITLKECNKLLQIAKT
jgi:hypothetical protein